MSHSCFVFISQGLNSNSNNELLIYGQAVSMMLLNHKMAANEAWENGLVVEVLKADKFMEQVNNRVKSLTTMSGKVLERDN